MKEKTTILCYGDSNTYGFDPEGFRYGKNDLWTTLLENKLGDSYKVINAGLNGRTTALDIWGEATFEERTDFDQVVKRYPDVDTIIFMLGSNDCLVAGNSTDIQKGMEDLIQYAKNVYSNPTIVLVVPAALNLHSYSAGLSRELAPLYKTLADQYHCLYVDGTNLFELHSIDGIHLTKRGHQQVAQKLYEVLK